MSACSPFSDRIKGLLLVEIKGLLLVEIKGLLLVETCEEYGL